MIVASLLVPIPLARADPPTIVVDRVPHRIVGCHAMPLTVETGGAIGLSYLRQGRGNLDRLTDGEFWRTLLERSAPAKGNIHFVVVRFDLDLDDGRQVAIDRDGRIAVLPKGTEHVIGWKGPVRELTEAQRARLLKIGDALATSPPTRGS